MKEKLKKIFVHEKINTTGEIFLWWIRGSDLFNVLFFIYFFIHFAILYFFFNNEWLVFLFPGVFFLWAFIHLMFISGLLTELFLKKIIRLKINIDRPAMIIKEIMLATSLILITFISVYNIYTA